MYEKTLIKERLLKCYIEWDKLRNIMGQNLIINNIRIIYQLIKTETSKAKSKNIFLTIRVQPSILGA